jgi:hypothetical protein
MGIHWALPQLEALLPVDLKEQLLKVSVDPSLDAPDADTMRIWNGKDGGILKEIPIPRTIRFSRRKLREFCTQGIDVNVGWLGSFDCAGLLVYTLTLHSTVTN